MQFECNFIRKYPKEQKNLLTSSLLSKYNSILDEINIIVSLIICIFKALMDRGIIFLYLLYKTKKNKK